MLFPSFRQRCIELPSAEVQTATRYEEEKSRESSQDREIARTYRVADLELNDEIFNIRSQRFETPLCITVKSKRCRGLLGCQTLHSPWTALAGKDFEY